MTTIKKITTGFVVQEFDTEANKYIAKSAIADKQTLVIVSPSNIISVKDDP